jgi:simple sugar transport system ATP-binding protein
MHYNADLIILDEPTDALAVKEVRKVSISVRRIKDPAGLRFTSSTILPTSMRSPIAWPPDRGRFVAEISPKNMSVPEVTEYLIALQH